MTAPILASTAAPVPPVVRSRRLRASVRRKQTLFRVIVVTVVGAFFLIPLLSLLDFSTRLRNNTRTGEAWSTVFSIATASDDASQKVRTGLLNSLALVVLTVILMLALLVPTMTWIRLRVPQLRRTVEFVCLLPLTIPAIVLVVGLAPIYRGIAGVLSTDAIWLCFAYAVLVLPFAYRALDAGLEAIDVRTLAEAARSLGSSWFGVVWRIVLPNIRTAVISACFLSLALVLGEFTVASLLNRTNLQTSILLISQQDARFATALALIAILIGFLLLFGLSFFGRSRSTGRSARKATE